MERSPELEQLVVTWHVSPRWSAVFHLEDGVWRFVQTYASIGVANEDIGWESPG